MAAVGMAVKSGVVVGVRWFGMQLALTTVGRGVQRGAAAPRGGAMGGKPAGVPAGSRVVCYGCGGEGHLLRDCQVSYRSGLSSRPPFRCWWCGGLGHAVSACHRVSAGD